MTARQSLDRMLDTIRRRDADAFAELFTEQATLQHPLSPEPLRGRAEIRASEQALFDAFTDIEIEVSSVLTAERRAAVEVVLRATNSGPLEVGPGERMPATGRRIAVPAAWFYEYDEHGRVVAERDYFDTAAFMAQLGLPG